VKHISDDKLLKEIQYRLECNKSSNAQSKDMIKKLTEVNLKLEKSEALKSKFLSNIRNEINNPLAAIIGLSGVILSTKKIDLETIKSFVTQIYRDASNLDSQMRNIFAAAEIEAGEANPEITNVNIDEIISSVLDFFKNETIQKNIIVEYNHYSSDKTAGEILFKTDAEKFRLIVSNIVNNAFVYCSSGSTVNINLKIEDNNLTLCVKNHGVGISKENENLIFERFKQLDSRPNKNYQGHGLGLSVTRAMLNIMEGDITFKSDKDGSVTFTISIPEWENNNDNSNLFAQGEGWFFDESEKF